MIKSIYEKPYRIWNRKKVICKVNELQPSEAAHYLLNHVRIIYIIAHLQPIASRDSWTPAITKKKFYFSSIRVR